MNFLKWFSLGSALVVCLAAAGCATSSSCRSSKQAEVYEMRTYYAAPGKLDELHARFRNDTMRLFEKHGIKNVGYWVPVKNTENKLVFLLKYPNREARESSWKTFAADPRWVAAKAKSEEKGALVTKVDQTFLQLTDYSPTSKKGKLFNGGVFELRTYTTPPGKLPDLDARFRDHTINLFTKHGVNNWLYFHKTPDQPDADRTLVYFLNHQSADAAKASFGAFGKDPAWNAARTASEKNGPLTVKDGGIKSEFLVPTDYSPVK